MAPSERIAATPPNPELDALASRLPTQIHLGSSSWYFPGWQGIVWDEKPSLDRVRKLGLTAYSEHPLMRTVGMDRSYHGPVRTAIWETYRAQVNPDFRFIAKAAKYVLEPWGKGAERFLDPEFTPQTLAAWMREGLSEQAAGIVVQFTPQASGYLIKRLDDYEERLTAFLRAANAVLPTAIELRHRNATGNEQLQALLADAGVNPCLHVHPNSAPISDQAQASTIDRNQPLIIRWNLHPELSYAEGKKRHAPFGQLIDPDPTNRTTIAQLCRDAAQANQPVYVIINNKAEGSAPLSVIELAREIVDA